MGNEPCEPHHPVEHPVEHPVSTVVGPLNRSIFAFCQSKAGLVQHSLDLRHPSGNQSGFAARNFASVSAEIALVFEARDSAGFSSCFW